MKGKKFILIFITGLILVTEHILTYDYYDFELIGHETYGFILMIIGMFFFWYKNLRTKHPVIDSKTPEQHKHTNTKYIYTHLTTDKYDQTGNGADNRC